ncbi:N-acetylmuramoyl-L-alanine amidase [Edaphobacillus lindanitolerans]|uniref:N-acetylmuramoyl-L-alanine amidase n=1 Tax=Edaphobacillus lindanitolerans TaxID=550447 RepID=UPI003898F108
MWRILRRRVWVLAFVLVASAAVLAYEAFASDRDFFLPEPLGGVKVVIDPGHGGPDGGASAGDTIESSINLAIAKNLEKELKKKGATVIMTRTKEGDAIAEREPGENFPSIRARKMADLKLREEIAIKEKPDMFLSVHVNAIPDQKWRGAQVFYHAEGHPDSERLAKAVQSSFVETIETDREALAVRQVYLLKKVPTPAVLIETGFISNPEEKALLTDKGYQKKVAEAIADGVSAYMDEDLQ